MAKLRINFNYFFMALAVSLLPVVVNAQAGQYSTIVVEQQSGKILHGLEVNELAYPASVTKVMTLYMAFERLNEGKMTLDTMIPISKNASQANPTKLYLKEGDYISADLAIRAMVVKSANDVATAMGEYLGGGDEDVFAKMMTQKAKQMGMTRSQFRNASGLPDPNQVSTAADLAVLGRRMIEDFPQYYHYFSLRNFEFQGNIYGGHNRVLDQFAGADGMKTGYTNASGFNLLTSAEVDGKRVVAVVLGGRTGGERDRAMVQLLRKYVGRAEEYDDEAKLSKNNPPVVAAPKKVPVLAKNGKNKTPQKDDYKIQVGAFKQRDEAKERIKTALFHIPKDLRGELDYVVQKSLFKKQVVYRATISGFTKNEAINSCRNLKRKNIACLVLSS